MIDRYVVAWLIDIEAETPETAARCALAIQRDPESIAVVFAVTDSADTRHVIDLDDSGPTARRSPQGELLAKKLTQPGQLDRHQRGIGARHVA